MIVKFKKFIPFIFFFSYLLLTPQITFAYIGPGIALGTIITLLAVVGLFILALLSVSLYSKIEDDLALFIASIAAAQSVESIGNSKPVSKAKLLKTISFFKFTSQGAFEFI